jgi:hypothetical protein
LREVKRRCESSGASFYAATPTITTVRRSAELRNAASITATTLRPSVPLTGGGAPSSRAAAIPA